MSVYALNPSSPPPLRWLFAFVGAILLMFLLVGCGAKTEPLPPQAPPAVKVLVPVTQACEVAKVTPSTLPSAALGVADDIFQAVQVILADRAVLQGDREALVAANTDPCPQIAPR